jgi:hypothetical protein
MEEPLIEDCGSHLEAVLSAPGFAHANFVEVLAAARKRFGRKPMLVIGSDPGGVIGPRRPMTSASNCPPSCRFPELQLR